jgi:hypothetical protein
MISVYNFYITFNIFLENNKLKKKNIVNIKGSTFHVIILYSMFFFVIHEFIIHVYCILIIDLKGLRSTKTKKDMEKPFVWSLPCQSGRSVFEFVNMMLLLNWNLI